MAKRKRPSDRTSEPVVDLRHEGVTRLNIPPAGLAARGQIVREKRVQYAYNPHLAPTLRFDATGGADRIEELVGEAGQRRLEPAELRILQEALRNHEPWLEWSGKREQQWCAVDPVGDLLKTTVSGSPRTRVEAQTDGQFVVHMEGVDIYDPVSNSVYSAGAEKVAAWFLDSDYDGRYFCVCQAFFPDKDAWARLGKALKGSLDEEALSKLSGTVSLPFAPGEHKRIAIKVIDPRGNEVLRVHRLGGSYE